jgi:hypothetical protein
MVHCLDDAAVEGRMAVAPAWVLQRHMRSWRARRHAGDEVSRLQDGRDTLLSTWRAETLGVTPPYSRWLGVLNEPGPLVEQVRRLTAFLSEWTVDRAVR